MSLFKVAYLSIKIFYCSISVVIAANNFQKNFIGNNMNVLIQGKNHISVLYVGVHSHRNQMLKNICRHIKYGREPLYTPYPQRYFKHFCTGL